MRHHHTGSRPHVQGFGRPLRVRHSARNLTDGGGLVLIRKLFDRLGLGGWVDCRTGREKGFFRPWLMVEAWVVLLLHGGGVMDDLPLLDRRGVRRIFGWVRVPDPTTFGRWLRRTAERMVPLLDALLWHMVRRRWALSGGSPKRLTLVVDSTVVVRYGRKQAGAEVGYNPKKRGRPSHHPLVAFAQETGDCLGVIWRGGSAHTADGAAEWIGDLVGRLRAAGVEDITVRLDEGFFSRRMVRTLDGLAVSFLLKGAASPVAVLAPGPLAVLGEGRSGIAGRGPVDGVGQTLGRAAADGPDHPAPGERRSAGDRHLRGSQPGRHAHQHRWHPRPDGVAPLTTRARWSTRGSRSWPSCRRAERGGRCGRNALLWSLAAVA